MSADRVCASDGSAYPARIRVDAGQLSLDSVDPHYIRGCAISDVMINACAIMQDIGVGGSWGATSEAFEKLSRPAEKLDSFLSHTWAASRWKKLLQLALAFNLPAACTASACATVGCSIATILGLAPVLHFDIQKSPTGVVGFVVGSVVYYVVLLFNADLIGRVGFLKQFVSVVFFDKLCINQVDDEQKSLGIAALSAAIKRAKSLIILHSDAYLKRLWTNFELACYIAMHGTEKLIWIPDFVPVIVVLGSLLMSSTSLIYTVTMSMDELALSNAALISHAVYRAFGLLATWIAFGLSRRWVASTEGVDRELDVFDIRAAECSKETDRVTVMDLIAEFEVALGSESELSAREPLLDRFNERVRQDVRSAFLDGLGQNGICYKHVCAMLWTEVLWVPEELAALLLMKSSWQAIVTSMVISFLRAFCVLPLGIALLLWLSRKCLRLRKKWWKESLYRFVCTLVVAGLISGMLEVLLSLNPSTSAGARTLAPFAVIVSLILGTTCVVYHP